MDEQSSFDGSGIPDGFDSADAPDPTNQLIDASSLATFETYRKQKRKQKDKSLPDWAVFFAVMGCIASVFTIIAGKSSNGASGTIGSSLTPQTMGNAFGVLIVTVFALVLARICARWFPTTAGAVLSIFMVMGVISTNMQRYSEDHAQRKVQTEALLKQKLVENEKNLQVLQDSFESGEMMTDTSSLEGDAAYLERCAAIAPEPEKSFFLAAAETMRSMKALADAKVRAAVEHDELLNVSVEQYFEIDHLNKLVAAEKRLFNTSRAMFLFANDLPKTLERNAVIGGCDRKNAKAMTAQLVEKLRPQTTMKIHEIDMQVCDMLVEQHTFLLDRVGAWSIQDEGTLVFNDPQNDDVFWEIMAPSEALLVEQDRLMRMLLSSGAN